MDPNLDKALVLLQKYPDTMMLSAVYLNKGYNAFWEHDHIYYWATKEIPDDDLPESIYRGSMYWLIKQIDLEMGIKESLDDYLKESIYWNSKHIDLEKVFDFNRNVSYPSYVPIYYNLAFAYLRLNTPGDTKSGLKYLNEAKNLVDTLVVINYMKLYVYRLLGSLKSESGDYRAAIKIYKEGIKKAEEARMNYNIKNYDKINPFGWTITEDLYYTQILSWTYARISYAYAKLGDYKKAHEYYVLQEKARNEIYLEDNKNLIVMLEAESENEKTQNQISLLAKENEVKDLRINRSKIFIYGLGGLLLVLFFVGMLFIRQRRIRMALKEQKLVHDLELKKVESDKLKELDKMKSRFFANISHEFRTPLTLILGPLEKFRSKINDPESQTDLNIMQRNALRLQNLINQLLSLSKLESGKMKLQARQQSILQLVRGYTQNFESLAKQKGIILEIKSELGEILIWIDRDKIEKILYNLLSNAFKHTQSGDEITISVGVAIPEESDIPEEMLRIILADTGKGIPENQLPYIFDRFYQVESSNESNSEGTGIGLALTKELVELHHGKISVSSKEGEGSTFTVYLPLGDKHLSAEDKSDNGKQDDTTETSLLDSQAAVAEMISGSHGHYSGDEIADPSKAIILIVEDNTDLRSYIRGQLEGDYNILEAYDGKQGFTKAVDLIPDLILSDVMMPEMDGYELCTRVKSDERTSHIPLILLTARAAPESRIEGLETGADDFITKPFDPEELHIRIRNLIRQRKRLKEKFLRDIRLEEIQDGSEKDNEALISIDQKFLIRARETVKKYLSDESFDITMFSSEMNLSRTQLHRKLRALIDQSATEFIRTVRLNHASTLLRHKTGNISEIALEVGFSNPGYFAECFKKQFSILPSEYAKKFNSI